MKKEISILIIEDNEDDLLFLQESLASTEVFNPTFYSAQRLVEAFAIMQENTVDVAIIDLSLPDSNGLDTFLLFHETHPLTPSIIYSGHRDHEMAFQAVKKGAQDYLFKGDPSSTAIIRSLRYAIERQRLTTELCKALERVEELEGLLPICSYCKNIRDDKGYWARIESYISSRLETRFSHSICPDCAEKHFSDYNLFTEK